MILIFDKTNMLNSLSYSIEQTLKNNIPSKINIPNAIITTSRNPLTITSIANSNQYYILLLFPRSSNLRFASEGYGSNKKRTFRLDLIVVAQGDSQNYQLISKLLHFFDTNESLFTQFGLKRPKIEKEFLKVPDSKIFSGGLTGNFSAWGSNIYGEIVI